MSNASEPQSAQPAYGRRLIEQAHRLDVSPSSLIRHIRRGTLLSSGARKRLAATWTPGGYRITDEAIDEFYAALTRDRLGSERPPESSRSKEHEREEHYLQAAGF